MSIAQDLRNASDSLSEDNWYKGSYFVAKEQTLCMCVHGAVQAQVNDKVKAILSSQAKTCASLAGAAVHARLAAADTDAATAASEAACEAAIAAVSARLAAAPDAATAASEAACEAAADDAAVLYANRTHCHIPAHYIMGLVGLTAEYNDDKRTTLDMVKAKLEEAAKLAELIAPND